MNWRSADHECRAGDVIITRSGDEFLLFRVLARPEFGPWWELAGAAATKLEALRQASFIAPASSRVLWFDDGRLNEVRREGPLFAWPAVSTSSD